MTSHCVKFSICAWLAGALFLSFPAHGEETSATPPAGSTPQKSRPAEQKGLQEKSSAAPQPVGQAPARQEESKPPEIAPISDQPGVLTPRGTFVLEPSFQYTLTTNNRIALIGTTVSPALLIGLVDVRSVSRHTLITSLAGRYGITNRVEVEAKVPYVYQTETTSTREFQPKTPGEKVFTAEGNDIGDVEFGLRVQLNRPVTGPYFTGSLRAKAPTGTDIFEVPLDPSTQLATELPTGSGFWGIQFGVNAIYPSDPAVFFGGVSYLWNIERDKGRFGAIDPGDVIGFNFGMGLAINEKASISLGYDHSLIGKTKVNNVLFTDTQNTSVGSLLIGFSYKLAEKINVNLSLGAGLTEAAPDVQLALRVPITF